MPPQVSTAQFVGAEEVFTNILGRLPGILDSIRSAYNYLVGQVQKLIKAGALAGLAGYAAAKYYLQTKLQKIRDAVQKIEEYVQAVLEHGVPVVDLIRRGNAWITQVLTPASNMLSQVDGYELPGGAYLYDIEDWSGKAATVYKDKRSKQKDAVGDVVAKAEFMSKWLYGIATANVEYVTGLFNVLAEMMGDWTQAVIEGGSLIDVMFAISTVANICGKVVETGLKVLIDTANRVMESYSNVRDLTSVLGDQTKLPGGRWPQAVIG